MENVISEFRLIETDDGFRIEIKGDKEKIRGMIDHWMEARGRGWHGRPGHFPFGFAPWMHWDYPGKEESKNQA